jgi:hypothetical protein
MIHARLEGAMLFLDAGNVLDTSDPLLPPTRKRLRVMLRREYFTEAPDPTEEAKPGDDGELVIGEGIRKLEPGSDEHMIAALMETGADYAIVI